MSHPKPATPAPRHRKAKDSPGPTAIVYSDRSYGRAPDGSLRRLPDVLHPYLRRRIQDGRPRALFEAHELARWPSTPIGPGPGRYGLERPPKGIRLRDRLQAAWACLTHRAYAVRWY